jgi:hypothetical protein
MRAGPCLWSGFGSRNRGIGRPVGPTPRARPAAIDAGISPRLRVDFVDMPMNLSADLSGL